MKPGSDYTEFYRLIDICFAVLLLLLHLGKKMGGPWFGIMIRFTDFSDFQCYQNSFLVLFVCVLDLLCEFSSGNQVGGLTLIVNLTAGGV